MATNRSIFNAVSQAAAEVAAWFIDAAHKYNDDPNVPDLDKLLNEAAEQGYVSVPLNDLPPTFKSRVIAVLEHKHHEIIQEQQAIIDQRKHPDGQKKDKEEEEREKEWLKHMSPEYREAYAHFQEAVEWSGKTLDEAAAELEEVKRKSAQKIKEMEEQAVHLSDGRLAFRKGKNGFVDQYGADLAGAELEKARAEGERRAIPDYQRYADMVDIHERAGVELRKTEDDKVKNTQAGGQFNGEHPGDVAQVNAAGEQQRKEAEEQKRKADKITQKMDMINSTTLQPIVQKDASRDYLQDQWESAITPSKDKENVLVNTAPQPIIVTPTR